jgi:glutamyl-tRNA synthetase
LLYEYFGWKPPVLLHLPLLRNPDKSKLSKRKNPTGILFYRAMGYLPEALMNFLGLLVNPSREGEPEILDLQQMVERFELEHVPVGGPIFDAAKLDWIDGRYLRERLTTDDFARRIGAWAGAQAERWTRIAALAQPRVERLSDVIPLVAFLFAGRLTVAREALLSGKLDETQTRRALALTMWTLDALPEWNVGGIEFTVDRVAGSLGRKPREIARPLYVAISGSPTSIPLYDSMELLGRDMTRERLRGALETLGAPSKREQDDWRREFDAERAIV